MLDLTNGGGVTRILLVIIKKGYLSMKDELAKLEYALCEISFEIDYLVKGLHQRRTRTQSESASEDNPLQMTDAEHLQYVKSTLATLAADLQNLAQ